MKALSLLAVVAMFGVGQLGCTIEKEKEVVHEPSDRTVVVPERTHDRTVVVPERDAPRTEVNVNR